MAVATRHVLHGIQTPDVFLSQIENARPSPGIDVMVAGSAGFPQPLFTGNRGQRPEITFDSTQVKTLIDRCGFTIYDMSGGNTDLYFKKVKNLARREADASTVHTRLRMVEAGLLINSLTAAHRGPASANCRLFTIWDGSNEPLVPAGSVALAGTPTSAEHFGVGPVYINTVAVNGIQNVTIDLGRTMIEAGGDSELYDTFVAEGAIAPVVTITTTDLAWAMYGLNGVVLTALSVYFRKHAGGATWVANGTAQHIKFAATAGLVTIDDTPAGGNDPTTATIRCTLAAPDASGNALTVNSAIAITT